ncbi:MAG: CPBP family intramembrane metalloprotease [Candidatus Bathyarchaeota archaeon]|nr:CPBP family intramembrane metalloprotease [Candidatus Bathyarchaeota archaeon]
MFLILLSYTLSLTIRFLFGLEGVGLSVFEGINEIVKAGLSVGIVWLILRVKDESVYRKEYPKTETFIGLIFAGALITYGFLLFTQPYSTLISFRLFGHLGMYIISIVFTIRHYNRKELQLFRKELGLSAPTARSVMCWAVTILVFISLSYLSASGNFNLYVQDYLLTTCLFNWFYVARGFVFFAAEEIFYRVFLQMRLEKIVPTRWAIIIQSLLFYAAHIPSNAVVFGWGVESSASLGEHSTFHEWSDGRLLMAKDKEPASSSIRPLDNISSLAAHLLSIMFFLGDLRYIRR